MGKYINGIGTTYTEKVRNLLNNHNATQILTSVKYQPNLVCVIDNGSFAAAGYMYSEAEFNYVLSNTLNRRKTWLIVPNAEQLAID